MLALGACSSEGPQPLEGTGGVGGAGGSAGLTPPAASSAQAGSAGASGGSSSGTAGTASGAGAAGQASQGETPNAAGGTGASGGAPSMGGATSSGDSTSETSAPHTNDSGSSETTPGSSTDSETSQETSTETSGETTSSGSGSSDTTTMTSGDSSTGEETSAEPRSMGYVGCSMSVNVAQGYQALGGERLWPPVQAYNGKVVQNWTNSNDSAWQAFEQQMNMYGTPTDVWVMLCIFANMVNYEETKQIIANVRQRAPDARIYITGQPLYAEGLTCDLAGAGGPELTDSMAQMAGEDDSQDVTYAGVFGPLTSSQRSDSCHANTEGQQALGEQAIEKWGE